MTGTHADRYEINNSGELFIKNNSSSIAYGEGAHNVLITEVVEGELVNPTTSIVINQKMLRILIRRN